MKGVLSFITSNIFEVGQGSFPDETALTEEQLNTALREIWKASNGQVDLLLVGAAPEARHQRLHGHQPAFHGRGREL